MYPLSRICIPFKPTTIVTITSIQSQITTSYKAIPVLHIPVGSHQCIKSPFDPLDPPPMGSQWQMTESQDSASRTPTVPAAACDVPRAAPSG